MIAYEDLGLDLYLSILGDELGRDGYTFFNLDATIDDSVVLHVRHADKVVNLGHAEPVERIGHHGLETRVGDTGTFLVQLKYLEALSPPSARLRML